MTTTQAGGTPLVLGLAADVPEPGTWTMLLTGAGLLLADSAWCRRRALPGR